MSTRKNIGVFIEEQHRYVSLREIRADFDSAISLLEMDEEKRYIRGLKERISHLEEKAEYARKGRDEYEYQVTKWSCRIEDLEDKLRRRDKEIVGRKKYADLKESEFDGVRKEFNEKECLMEREIGTITAKAISLNEECEDLTKQNRELNKKNRGLAETLDSIRTLLQKSAKKTSFPNNEPDLPKKKTSLPKNEPDLADLPFDPECCNARLWNAGYGCQCNQSVDTDGLCALHVNLYDKSIDGGGTDLAHGRFNDERPTHCLRGPNFDHEHPWKDLGDNQTTYPDADSSNLEEYIHEGISYKFNNKTNIIYDLDVGSRMGKMKYNEDNEPYPEFNGDEDSE